MALPKSRIFLVCCLFFIFGIGAASYLPKEYLVYDLWYFGGAMLSLVIAVLFWNNTRFRLAGLAGLFFILGIWRYSFCLPANTPDKIWNYNGQAVNLIGIIDREPDARERSAKLVVSAREIHELPALTDDGHGSTYRSSLKKVRGKILITTGLYPEYKYGDELEIDCELQAPKEFSGFAYDRYLSRYDIYSVCYYPKIKKLAENKGNKIYAYIFRFKNKLREAIGRGLEEPSAGLARAIVLGDKRAVDEGWRLKFSQVGISHIIAISGMHISFLAVIVMGLLLWFGIPRQPAIYAASLILFLYIVCTKKR